MNKEGIKKYLTEKMRLKMQNILLTKPQQSFLQNLPIHLINMNMPQVKVFYLLVRKPD